VPGAKRDVCRGSWVSTVAKFLVFPGGVGAWGLIVPSPVCQRIHGDLSINRPSILPITQNCSPMRRLQLRFDFDSTAVRLPFFSKVAFGVERAWRSPANIKYPWRNNKNS